MTVLSVGLPKREGRRRAQSDQFERHAPGVGPEIKVAADELAALIDADRFRIVRPGADTFKGSDHVPGPVAEARIDLDRNRTKAGIFSPDGCCVGAFIILANKQTMIARHKAKVVGQLSSLGHHGSGRHADLGTQR